MVNGNELRDGQGHTLCDNQGRPLLLVTDGFDSKDRYAESRKYAESEMMKKDRRLARRYGGKR